MKKLRVLIVAVFLFLCSGYAYGQKFDHAYLEAMIHRSIEKAYAASVRIWGFDVDKQMRNSGQFSGVVVSAEGYILTAAHVNVPGNTYMVMFPDGSSKIARGLGEIELEGNRSVPDVAMMKIIDSGTWPYAEMGWSYSLKKDEPCISIAYPETLNQAFPTIRFGYVAEVQNKYGFIRSTCLMEPGDSGGPLFDVYGRVIGLHSAIDVNEKDNFEVPVDLYRKYWTALNKAETYKSYPPHEDIISKDTLVDRLMTIAGLKIAEKLKPYACLVKSNVDGSQKQVQGILFQSDTFPLKNTFKNGSILISKSSLVGDNPIIQFKGKQIQATVIGRDRDRDLVLLQASSKLEGGIRFDQLKSGTLQFPELGKFLISKLFDGTSKISIIGSTEFEMPKMMSSGFLGAGIGYKDGNLMLTFINPGSPASDADLQAEDKILGLDGKSFSNPDDFFIAYLKHWPGDEVVITVRRYNTERSKDTTLLKTLTLGWVPERHFDHPAEKFAGGKSYRRDGFSRVFVHDAILKPEECGGALFDLEGHFYGINIARFSRTSVLAISATDILRFMLQYIP